MKIFILPKNKIKGFTLAEIMVSVSVFVVVMSMAGGSIYSVIEANRKSQNMRSVMDNLNYSLESMTRTIRFGKNYHCNMTLDNISTPRDCSIPGANSLVVTSPSGSQVIYKLDGTRIVRNSGGNDQNLTGSDVNITNLTFLVSGSNPYNNGANLYQPQVLVVISGYVGTKATSRSSFTIQTTISQRVFDTQ